MKASSLLRSTYGRSVAKTFVLAFLMTSIYNVMSFSTSTQAAISRSFDESAKVDMYSLTDRLTDPALFEGYRRNLANIEKVTRFYDYLEQNAPDGVQLLSAFDQAMPVADFAGGETFEHGYGTGARTQGPYEDPILGKSVVNVKSMQLSRSTFDFYNLAEQDGTELDWDGVNYDGASIPVLLGDNYKSVYAVGDQLTVDYYSKPTQMRVSGFLPPSASMFYQENLNFFLDDYLVVPYPKSITGMATAHQDFYGILAFAMLNANIAVDQAQPSGAVFRALESAATSSQFDHYALLSVPGYLTQFASVRALVQENFALVVTIEILVAAAAVVVSAVLTSSAIRRRERRIRVAWQLGESRSDLLRAMLAIVAVEYAALTVAFLTITQLLPNHDSSALRLCLGFIALFSAAEMLHRRSWLQHDIQYHPRSEL
ncbi:hypothetical protein [Frigoribacterium sp. R86507]|uniref:hypothetical protein n=1 Tax=Frigoribacterium sp. R86507 TaxID=3093850 RepID=UPI0037CB8A8E